MASRATPASPPPPPPSTGRPSRPEHASFWLRNLHVPATVKRWLLEGFRIPFLQEPPPSFLPNYVRAENHDFVDSELARLLQTGAIVRVEQRPHNVSPLTCAPKKNGKLRLCIDMRFVNESVQAPPFKLEDLTTLAPLLNPNDHLATADLSEGYHHLRIHPDHWKHLGLEWRGHFYVYTVLPFGLSCAPWAFTKFVRPLVEYLRMRGLRLVCYIDDFIIAAEPPLARSHVHIFRETMRAAGFVLKDEKCHFEPSTSQTFLGYDIQTAPAVRFCVPADKRRAIRHELKRLLSRDGPVPVRRLAHVAGLCLSVSRAIAPAKLLLRNLYRDIANAPCWSAAVGLSDAARADLRWWIAALDGWNGACPLPRPADLTLSTDASDLGWGAAWDDRTACGSWTEAMAARPINERESMAVLNALRIWGASWAGKTVCVQCDNATTVAHLNGFGRLNERLDTLARAIHSLAAEHGISLRAVHVAGTTNTSADALSRQEDRSDWQLHPSLFRSLDRLWGPHTIDRMASFRTRQLPRYESRHNDVESLRADTLSALWSPSENSYVCPPFSLIHRVLRHVQLSQCDATLIAPLWPGQPWWPLLRRLAVDYPIVLPSEDPRAYFPASTGHVEPLKNRSWRVCAWRISGARHPPIGATALERYLRRL